MDKRIRQAVRCFIFRDDEVVCIKYLKGKIGFYDIPGGKIEEGETPKKSVYRECLEETGIGVKNPIYKGTIYVDYPDRSYILKTFVATNYTGETTNFDDNISKWIKIEDLLLQEKRNALTTILEAQFIGCLYDSDREFEFRIKCDNEENIIEQEFKYI